MELLYGPVTALLKSLYLRGTLTPTFIAVLFTIAKTYCQPGYPSTNECYSPKNDEILFIYGKIKGTRRHRVN
jgi:hypothetical protein